MKKLFILILTIALISSLSMGGVSAGWYGTLQISGNQATNPNYYRGTAYAERNSSTYFAHAQVDVGYYYTGATHDVSPVTRSVSKTLLPYDTSTYYKYVDITDAGNAAYCLAEVGEDSDNRSYTQKTYHT
ncbi:MAG: hypothetical protein IKX68_01770 [Clostridiales bacterium]|nr:hypothetical protein [Clostridiales bacterium]